MNGLVRGDHRTTKGTSPNRLYVESFCQVRVTEYILVLVPILIGDL